MSAGYRIFFISIIYGLCLGLFASANPARAANATAFEITSSTDLLTGDLATGVVSDFCLANDQIVLIISDIPHDGGGAVSGGNIIDAGTVVDRFDALTSLYTYFDDNWPRQATYTQISIHNSGDNGEPAVIRVLGSDTDRPSLVVITDYILEGDSPYVTLETTLTNTGGQTLNNFELGDAFHWGSCDNFAPGYGFSLPGNSTEPWMAGRAEGITYGYTSPADEMWGPNGSYWSDLNVLQVNIQGGESVSFSRYFVVGGNDIASVSDIVHQLKEKTVGVALCQVTDNESNPISGATINAFDANEDFYLQMSTDASGAANATLAPGNWLLQASATGYGETEASISIVADQSVNQHLILSTEGVPPVGDTLTVIQRPLVNIPAIVVAGETFTIDCEADPSTTGWAASLVFNDHTIPLTITDAQYDSADEWWHLIALLPAGSLLTELYDLHVTADDDLDDTTSNSVKVIPTYKSEYYFIHITDTHLPTHLFNDDPGAETDSSEVMDLREVIADIDIINPEFVVHTGDLINEGEMEDYLYWRYFTRTQRHLTEFTVPIYVVAGNHDIGGWTGTAPPAGTGRRTWWRFFGWGRLDNPPAGAPWYTQNYSFDYGSVHFTGLEGYNNYDSWRPEIYGTDSFTSVQLSWLADDLASSSQTVSQVLFYHYDFLDQINLSSLGVEMALYGHIHRDEGSVTQQPYNLATNNTCDGERSYRLIRVVDNIVTPLPSFSAGDNGENLQISYTPANDGTNHQVTATLDNNLNSRFEHAQVKFNLPAGSSPVEVVGGLLAQIDDSGSSRICYVNVDLQANTTQEVTAFCTASDVDTPTPSSRLILGAPQPNPFRNTTTVSYQLPDSAPVHLSILDPSGREVFLLVDQTQPAGLFQHEWRGLDTFGNPVPAGVYFIRLHSEKTMRLRKLIVMR